jgi:hypothetical protein
MPLYIGGGLIKGNAEFFLGGRAIEGPNRIITTSPTLTISSTVFVHGGGGRNVDPMGSVSGIGNGSSAIINHGTIRADNTADGFWSGEFDLLGSSLFNDGVIAIGSTSFLFAARGSSQVADLTFGPQGVLQVDVSSTANRGLLRVVGHLDLATSGDILMLNAGPQIQFNTPYRIATASQGILGQFDFVPAGFEILYQGNDIYVKRVPEPVCLVTLATMVTLMRGARRK